MVVAALGSAAVAAAVAEVVSVLKEGRSVALQIDNNTDYPLHKIGDRQDHGTWAVPPKDDIPSHSSMVFGAQSDGFLTGTEGETDWAGPDFTVGFAWDNPWAGSNSSNANFTGGPNAGNFETSSSTGGGDNGAHMVYEVHQIAPEVHGDIRIKWDQLGGAGGFLGNPTTSETGTPLTPNGVGRYNHFQGGSIYWTAATGAHEVHGAIRDKWASLGWEQGFLGYPLTDETGTPDGAGRYNHFQHGSIYWTPATGAHEVHGAIRDKWASLGWEKSALGYPTSDETEEPDGSGRFSSFQHGSIHWNKATGQVTVKGLNSIAHIPPIHLAH